MRIFLSIFILCQLFGGQLATLQAATCPFSEGLEPRAAAPSRCADLAAGERQENCRLGERLFSDKTLSSDGKASCASCHDARHDYADGRERPFLRGHELALSRTIRLKDLSRRPAPYFWNGRAQSLNGALFWPLYQAREMGAEAKTLARYGGSERVVSALADYLATVNGDTDESPWDRYRAGDCQSLGEVERKGLRIFRQNACESCHQGSEFSGIEVTRYRYKNLPQEFFDNEESRYGQDWQRHGGEKQETVALQVKPPSLRHLSAPYGQFGQEKDLFPYMLGHETQVLKSGQLDASERMALIAFLRSLSPR